MNKNGVYTITKIDNINVYCLMIKFGKKEHLEQLKNGSVYFSDYNNFHKVPFGQGDNNEGLFRSNQIVTLSSIDGKHIFSHLAHIAEESREYRHLPIFCACVIKPENYEVIEVKDNILKAKIHIDIEKFKRDFWEADYGLLMDFNEFEYKFLEYFSEKNIPTDQGFVKYYDFNDNKNSWLSNKVNKLDRLYQKTKELEYQNEVRFVIAKELDKGKNHMKIELGKFQVSYLDKIDNFKEINITLPILSQ